MKNKIKISILLSAAICVMMAAYAFAGEWVQEGENWKYKDDNGAFVVSDWKFIKTAYYYFDEYGNMCTGLKKIGNYYHSFNADGSANSNSTVNVFGTNYKTKKKGILEDSYNKTIDVDAYNAQFKIDHAPKTAEQLALEQAAAEKQAKNKALQDAAAEDFEKRGPKSAAAKSGLVGNDKNSGPGAIIQ